MTEMSQISRREASLRLMCKWIEALLEHPHTVLRLPLEQVLTEVNIAAVRTLDLYPEYSLPSTLAPTAGITRCWLPGWPRCHRQAGGNKSRLSYFTPANVAGVLLTRCQNFLRHCLWKCRSRRFAVETLDFMVGAQGLEPWTR